MYKHWSFHYILLNVEIHLEKIYSFIFEFIVNQISRTLSILPQALILIASPFFYTVLEESPHQHRLLRSLSLPIIVIVGALHLIQEISLSIHVFSTSNSKRSSGILEKTEPSLLRGVAAFRKPFKQFTCRKF